MGQNTHIQAVILAAGKGTRMRSPKAKILHRVGGRPLLHHTLTLVNKTTTLTPLVVILPRSITVRNLVQNLGAKPVVETTPQGTASTLRTALPYIDPSASYLLVLNSDDSFLYSQDTINLMTDHHLSRSNHLTFLTTIPPQSYPNVKKVIRDSNNNFVDLQPSDTINEVVCGAYIFKKSWLIQHLPMVKINPAKNEYFITDLLLIAIHNSSRISPFLLPDHRQWWGVNTKEDLKHARKLRKELDHES